MGTEEVVYLPIKLAQALQDALFSHPGAGSVPVPASLLTLVMEELRKTPWSERTPIAPPTEDEIAAYRNLFRSELDKRMDTKHPSASPSTESHAIALRAFVEARNKAAARG